MKPGAIFSSPQRPITIHCDCVCRVSVDFKKKQKNKTYMLVLFLNETVQNMHLPELQVKWGG